jgi:hypothetical protein
VFSIRVQYPCSVSVISMVSWDEYEWWLASFFSVNPQRPMVAHLAVPRTEDGLGVSQFASLYGVLRILSFYFDSPPRLHKIYTQHFIHRIGISTLLSLRGKFLYRVKLLLLMASLCLALSFE